MEKKLENYIHLYANAEFEVNGVRGYYYMSHFSQVVEVYHSNSESEESSFHNHHISEIKPCLLPLSKIDGKTIRVGRLSKFAVESKLLKAEEFLFLLDNDFDLFGLIQAGIAVDKTKL